MNALPVWLPAGKWYVGSEADRGNPTPVGLFATAAEFVGRDGLREAPACCALVTARMLGIGP